MLRTINEELDFGNGVLSNGDIHSAVGSSMAYIIFMKRKLRKAKMSQGNPALNVVCPICDAARYEECHVQIGVLRSESHTERTELAANEQLDTVALSEALAIRCAHRSPGDWGVS
jgi:hypothetical protein